MITMCWKEERYSHSCIKICCEPCSCCFFLVVEASLSVSPLGTMPSYHWYRLHPSEQGGGCNKGKVRGCGCACAPAEVVLPIFVSCSSPSSPHPPPSSFWPSPSSPMMVGVGGPSVLPRKRPGVSCPSPFF